MISTVGLVIFGVILGFQFVLYWLGILGTYLSTTKNIQEEKDFWKIIKKAEDIWFLFWVKSILPILMILFFIFLRSIGM